MNTTLPSMPKSLPSMPKSATVEGSLSISSVCVYCGSAAGSDPAFAQAAIAVGRAIAEAGVRLVYGGGDVGLMGIVARAVLDHGGSVTGIIPAFLKERENMILDAQETIVVPDMHTRKQMMFERADAFIALPGGVGTLEELVEQLTWAQLGRHDKPILVLNTADFWKPLLVLMAHMRQFGFIRPGAEVHYLVAERPEDVMPMLISARAHQAAPDINSADNPETRF
jgi:uncharacterized protein (TIGR00730 family)